MERLAAIAADPTHLASASAARAIRDWEAAKRITRAGHGALLCAPVAQALERVSSVRARARLQSKYDRGID